MWLGRYWSASWHCAARTRLRFARLFGFSCACLAHAFVGVATLVGGDSPAAFPDATGISVAASSDEMIKAIDRQLAEHWREMDLVPSKAATDGEWCRRVFLDVIGRVPTLYELQTYLAARGRDKRAKLVDRLLSDEYEEEYARHWAAHWVNLLIGRANDDGRLVSREGMRLFLLGEFRENRPYNELVTELLTASGSTVPGREDFRGSVNFLSGKLGDQAVLATSRTASLFLGVRVECTQCHNHPFNNWKQNQFWELNAFFRQTRVRTLGEGPNQYAVLLDEDFSGDSGTTPEEAEVYYELRNGYLMSAYPVFIDGREAASRSGRIRDISRRAELARFVTSAEEFPRAMVNRMWAHFFGHGFVRPIDDMGPHNAPVLPGLLDVLADGFRAHEYDLKRLMRWLVLSEAYALSSRASRRNASDEPSSGRPPAFSRFYPRQMTAEQLYDSLLTATAADQTKESASEQREVRERWLRQFVASFGTDDQGERVTFDGTIPQALMMMNGELMARATQCEPGSFLHRIATEAGTSNEQKIERLYLAALARPPSKGELHAANLLWSTRGGDAAGVLQDVWWALLNSNEFILNH